MIPCCEHSTLFGPASSPVQMHIANVGLMSEARISKCSCCTPNAGAQFSTGSAARAFADLRGAARRPPGGGPSGRRHRSVPQHLQRGPVSCRGRLPSSGRGGLRHGAPLNTAAPWHPSSRTAHPQVSLLLLHWLGSSCIISAGQTCRLTARVALQARNAFCAVRPPGHHAGPTGVVSCENEPHGSHGFCLLNNVAIGGAYALNVHRHHGAPQVARRSSVQDELPNQCCSAEGFQNPRQAQRRPCGA